MTTEKSASLHEATTAINEQFKTLSDIVKDPLFIEYVGKNVNELIKNRITRPAPKPGYYYKRDWYDRLSEKGNVNSFFFLNNIENIWKKKSALSSEIRSVIQYVCDKAYHQTVIAYLKQSQPKPDNNQK